MFHGNACTLPEIAEIMRGIVPVGRKITLNFAIAGYTIDPQVLLCWFPAEWYIVKLTPMHKISTASASGIATVGDYTTPEPYIEIENRLKKAGYEVMTSLTPRLL